MSNYAVKGLIQLGNKLRPLGEKIVAPIKKIK